VRGERTFGFKWSGGTFAKNQVEMFLNQHKEKQKYRDSTMKKRRPANMGDKGRDRKWLNPRGEPERGCPFGGLDDLC